MKKKSLVVFSLSLLLAGFLFINVQPALAVAGQWSSSGTTIYYNDGNVGLGTSSPQSEFHITGPSGTSILADTGNDTNFLMQADSNLLLRTDRNNNEANNYIAFQDHTGQFLMKVQANGNIGIKTNNPTAELSVYGTVLAKQVIVSTAASYWPDYVFADDYNLKPLSEVASFIKENKHLPGIESASEIEKSGLSLGDMQKKQMEKIEELTLYTIQLDKENTELRQELSDIKSRLLKLEM